MGEKIIPSVYVKGSNMVLKLVSCGFPPFIFADAAVHLFPNYDLGLLFRPKLLSSVRQRDFAAECFFFGIVPYKKYFARRHKVIGFAARISSHVYLRTVRTSFRELFFCFPPEPTYLDSC